MLESLGLETFSTNNVLDNVLLFLHIFTNFYNGESECLNNNFRPSRSVKTQNFDYHEKGIYSASRPPSWSEITSVLFLFLFFVFQVFCKTADLKSIENPRCRQKAGKIIAK